MGQPSLMPGTEKPIRQIPLRSLGRVSPSVLDLPQETQADQCAQSAQSQQPVESETIPSQPSPAGKHRAFSFPRPPPQRAPHHPAGARTARHGMPVCLSAARWFYFTRKSIQPPPPLSSGLAGGWGGCRIGLAIGTLRLLAGGGLQQTQDLFQSQAASQAGRAFQTP